MTKPSLLLSVFLLCLSVNYEAWACSCDLPDSIEQHIEETDVIFKGVPLRTLGFPWSNRMRTEFEIVKTWKGDLQNDKVFISHSRDVCCTCGVSFEKGVEVLIFAHRYKGKLATSSCVLYPLWVDPEGYEEAFP